MAAPNNNDYLEVDKKTASDFIFGKVIGEGRFSTIYLAREVQTNNAFAIKVLEKAHVIREKKTEHVLRENKILCGLCNSSKYFVHLYCTFQDPERIYFVLTYARNGELLKYINLYKKFNVNSTRYYSAELVLALEYLHSMKIVHNDLNAKNILFDQNFHILITDFGSAKIGKDELNQTNGETEQNIREPQCRKNSFFGTTQFISPEMLRGIKSSFSSDLWAFGCVVFQMASGQMPFLGENKHIIFQKILRLEYTFPVDFDERLKDFVKKLLFLEPADRLGATDKILYASLRGHSIFDAVNWDDLGPPPKLSDVELIESHKDAVSGVDENTEPGFNSKKASKLATDKSLPFSRSITQKKSTYRKITDISPEDIQNRLRDQETNPYNVFVAGNLILKQGFLLKYKGPFWRRKRIFLLTLGPHLYYVDPTTMTLKGEIPWSSDIQTETKNLNTFFIHTPNHKYHLKDPNGYAWEWIKAIDEVKKYYFPDCISRSD